MDGKQHKHTKKGRIRRVVRQVSMILRVPQTFKDARGITAENRAFKVAQYCQKKKLIKDVKATERFSTEDKEGIDISITQLDGTVLLLDVSTYWSETKAKKCQELGTVSFPVGPGEDEEEIRKRMLGVIIADLMSRLDMEGKREVISFIIQKIEERAHRKPKSPLIKRLLKRLLKK